MCAEGPGWFGVPQILTPLCGGRSEVPRGPELGVSPFSRGLMGPVVCVWRFLCRRTKAGLSAPLVSPSSSLKSPVAATRNPEGARDAQSRRHRNLKGEEDGGVLGDGAVTLGLTLGDRSPTWTLHR